MRKDVIRDCAKRWDSFFLYDEAGILESMERLKRHFPQAEFLYSMKCNPNRNVLRTIFQQGFGADAASFGEVELARQAGLSRGRIYYSAPGKSGRELGIAVSRSTVIADSIGEIGRISRAAEEIGETVRIGIRVNPDFSFTSEEGGSSKFGIDEEEAARYLKSSDFPKNVKVVGIHTHLKSQELDAGVLAGYHAHMFDLAGRFAKICGGLDFVNMGSGLGIPFSPDDQPLDLDALGASFAAHYDTFHAAHPETRVLLETGRYVVGKNGWYVTKVMDRKVSYGRTYLILKNTLNGFVRPSIAVMVSHFSGEEKPPMSEPLFTAVDAFPIGTLKDEAPSEDVTLVGNLCTGQDVIAEKIRMPHLEPGDVVVIGNAGAYAASITPMQFASLEPPKELLVVQDGRILE